MQLEVGDGVVFCFGQKHLFASFPRFFCAARGGSAVAVGIRARVALLLALLLLLLGPAMASGAEMPRPFTLFKSGCALADRSSPDVFAIELALAPK